MKTSSNSSKSIKTLAALFLCAVLSGVTIQQSFAAPPVSSSKGIEGAYQYLSGRIRGIGLIDSYGDSATTSYTYDNALAVMAFAAKGDYVRARTILSTYRDKLNITLDGGYYDLYGYNTGIGSGNVAVGPNAWLLNAINLYVYKTGDTQFSVVAQSLADFLVGLQDTDGGLFVDAYVPWKSTENNLAGYAGLYNYGISSGNELYVQKANLVKNFLITECWNGERFLRGENDPIEVTDTQSLGVLSLGTSYASAVYWAEYHTKCTKKIGRTSVTGFDFNNDLDTVWMEGTLQQAMAFKKNYDDYRAGIYYSNIDKTQRTNGSFLCATNTGTTGTDWILFAVESVAPTCWYIFYNTNTNPMMR